MWHKGKIKKKTGSAIAEYASCHCVFRAWILNAYKQEGNIFYLFCTDCSALSSVQIPISSTGFLTHIWDWTASPFLLWRPAIQPSPILSHLSPHSKHLFDIFPLSSLWSVPWLLLYLWTLFDLWCQFALSKTNYLRQAFPSFLRGNQELSSS